jgi:hypothetical protein
MKLFGDFLGALRACAIIVFSISGLGFYVNTRRISNLISTEFYNELVDTGHTTQLVSVAHSSHSIINMDFGATNDVVSQKALNFILQTSTINLPKKDFRNKKTHHDF